MAASTTVVINYLTFRSLEISSTKYEHSSTSLRLCVSAGLILLTMLRLASCEHFSLQPPDSRPQRCPRLHARRRPQAGELGADRRLFQEARRGERPDDVSKRSARRRWVLRLFTRRSARPENLKNLEKYKQINAKLADPRKMAGYRVASPAQPETPREEARSPQGKTIVLITCGIHSTEVGSTLSVDADRPPTGEQQRARDQEDPRQHDHPARPDPQSRRRRYRQKLVRQNARHAVRRHRRRRSFITNTSATTTTATGTPSRRSRRSSRSTRSTTSGTRRSSTTSTSRARTARGSSCRRTWHPVEPNVPKQIVEGYTELGNAMAADLRSKGFRRDNDQLDLRRLDTGTRLFALPRRRANPVRNRLGTHRLADHRQIRRPPRRLRRPRRQKRIPKLRPRLERRRMEAPKHHRLHDHRRVQPAESRGGQSREMAVEVL